MMLTWAEVDLDNIRHNLSQIGDMARSKNAELMAVVKDDAYGHGLAKVTQLAEEAHVKMLGVATIEEAIKVREVTQKVPTLVLGCILPDQAEYVVKHNITQTVCDVEVCKELSKCAEAMRIDAKVHVKVDTGMGRIGVMFDDVSNFVERIINLPRLKIHGIFTHLSVADSDPDFTHLQIDRFKIAIGTLKKFNIQATRHVANSSAILSFPNAFFDMVRPGIAIYGVYPNDRLGSSLGLKPALSVKTRIVHIKELPPGWSISYGRTFITTRNTRIATLPVGYGHGYNRKLSNRGEVLIRGKRCPIIGTVCMDQTMCDITHVPEAKVGDEVVLIGKQLDQEITVQEIAKLSETIPYEVLCNIGKGVHKVYLNDYSKG